MTDNWQPALIPEILARISSEVRDFEPLDHSQWAQCQVPPLEARIRRSDEYGDESAYVVARDGQAVIYFDDAEDGFSGAKLDARGWLQNSRFFGDLKHALRGFRRGAG